MNSILLDTHIWIWYMNGSKELPKSVQKTINQAIQNQKAHIAAISLWEMAMLESKGRIILEMPCLEWIQQSLKLTHIKILPFTPSIAVDSCQLPGTFHGDPADQIIVATARIEQQLLVTHDARILQYSRLKFVNAMKA